MLNEKEIMNPKNGFSAKTGGITRGSQNAFVTETRVLFVSCVLSDFWSFPFQTKKIGSNFHMCSWKENTASSEINISGLILYIYVHMHKHRCVLLLGLGIIFVPQVLNT